MKALSFRLCLSAAVLPVLILAAAHAAGPQKSATVCPPDTWGYRPPIGPGNWAGLSPCNTQCADGGEQSPINIVGAQSATLPSLM